MSLPTATSAPALREPWHATGTRAFLIWVAFCDFVTVSGATYLFWDRSAVIRVLASLAALAVGVIAAFGLPALASRAGAREREESPSAAARERQPERRWTDERLTSQLASGTRLRGLVEQTNSGKTGPLGLQIDSWIDETRALLEASAPDLADYFAADRQDTAETNWPLKLEDAIKMSLAGRLNRHLDRLTEILSRRSAWS